MGPNLSENCGTDDTLINSKTRTYLVVIADSEIVGQTGIFGLLEREGVKGKRFRIAPTSLVRTTSFSLPMGLPMLLWLGHSYSERLVIGINGL